MELGLEGRRAIVTGGSRGIGAATARALAAEGARVGLIGRDEALLRQVASECGGGAGHAVFAVGDLSTAHGVEHTIGACLDGLAESTSWSTTPARRPWARSTTCPTSSGRPPST